MATFLPTPDNCGDKGGRQLGSIESMQQLLLVKYSACVYWHVAVIQSSQPLQRDHVKKALDTLSETQEALQMRILPLDTKRDDPTEFKFERMLDPNKVDFDVVKINAKDEWPKVISKDQTDNKMDTVNGPLWRFIFCPVEARDGEKVSAQVHEYVLLLKLHHAISDVRSVTDMIYRQFLPVLSATANGRDTKRMVPFVPLTKSVEEIFLSKDILHSQAPWYLRLSARVLQWKNRILQPTEIPDLRFPDEHAPTEDFRQEVFCVPKVFGKEISESVVKAAKSNGVTVHAVLLVAVAVALSRTAKAAGSKLPKSFRQVWPVDLRKFLQLDTPQPLGAVSNTASSTHYRISDIDSDTFWKTCKQVYSNIKAEAEKKNLISMLGYFNYFLPDFAKENLATLAKEAMLNQPFVLSNFGNFSADLEPELPDRSTKLQLTEQFFSLLAPSTYILFQSVITYKGRIMWNITFSEKKVSRKFVDMFYTNLEEIFESFCMSL